MSRPSAVKLRSLAACTAVLAAALACAGCYVESRHYPDGCVEDDWGDLICSATTPSPSPSASATTTANEPSASPLTVLIDSGKTLDANPGEGVGLFFEYAGGGHWHLHTTCDTSSSGYGCDFSVDATPQAGSSLDAVADEGLSGDDVAETRGGSLHFAAHTTTGSKGVTFTTAPGALLEVQTYLDGNLEGRYVYWVGSGVLHAGAPTNPLVLQPSAK